MSEERLWREVLHEFGHALGCMHEKVSLAGGILLEVGSNNWLYWWLLVAGGSLQWPKVWLAKYCQVGPGPTTHSVEQIDSR